MNRRTAIRAILVILLIQLSVTFAALARGIQVLPEGPAVRIADTSRAIARGEPIRLPSYTELDRTLRAESAAAHALVWNDYFALGRDGTLLPKHPFIVSLCGALLYRLAGENGFLILAQLWLFAGALGTVALVLRYSTYRTRSDDAVQERIALRTICLIWGLTQTIFYVPNFSYDLMNTAVIVTGLALAGTLPVVSGFLVGASALVRPSNLLLVPAAPFLVAMEGQPRSRIIGAACGAAFALVLFGAMNTIFWGGPLTTAYHRNVSHIDGELVVGSHGKDFDPGESLRNLPKKLFDLRVGLVTYNPVLLVLPFALIGLRRHPARRPLYAITAIAGVQLAYVFSYWGWYGSLRGNRFLFPAIYCSIIPIAVWLCAGRRREPERPLAGSGR